MMSGEETRGIDRGGWVRAGVHTFPCPVLPITIIVNLRRDPFAKVSFSERSWHGTFSESTR